MTITMMGWWVIQSDEKRLKALGRAEVELVMSVMKRLITPPQLGGQK